MDIKPLVYGTILLTLSFTRAAASLCDLRYGAFNAPYNECMVLSNAAASHNELPNNTKRMLGQYFTVANPFHSNCFYRWMNQFSESPSIRYVEPFAGTNNIIKLLSDLGFADIQWSSFDIDPQGVEFNKAPTVPVVYCDTISGFPKGFEVAITNPPYLAKNSATRRKQSFPETQYEDLYLVCLEQMLANCKYVAAIIPESFLNQNLFQDRLHAVISLNCRMFDDTDCPVCLALFNPETNNGDFRYVVGLSEYSYSDLKEKAAKALKNLPAKVTSRFNSKRGNVGLYAVDSNSCASIKFVAGDAIGACKVKSTSRSVTRIRINLKRLGIDEAQLIAEANRLLDQYRLDTKDVFMTPFKGLRKDGSFRRRLDFSTAKQIIGGALCNLKST